MNKAILFVALLAATLKAQAVPYVEVTFFQDNWRLYWSIQAKGFEQPTQCWFYNGETLMGIGVVAAEGNGMSYNGYLNPADGGLENQLGIYRPNIRYDIGGIQSAPVYGAEFEILAPTGERPPDPEWGTGYEFPVPDVSPLPQPQPVPDGGGTLGLLALGLCGLVSLYRRPGKCE